MSKQYAAHTEYTNYHVDDTGTFILGDATLVIKSIGCNRFRAEYVGPKFNDDICEWLEKHLPTHDRVQNLIGNTFFGFHLFEQDENDLHIIIDKEVHDLLYRRYLIDAPKEGDEYPLLLSFTDPYDQRHILSGMSLAKAIEHVRAATQVLEDMAAKFKE